MTKCFVKPCKSSDRNHPEGVTFHKIPMKMKKVWLRAIKRPTNVFIINQRICSLHFESNDFEEFGQRRKLKAGAIPSRNVPAESPLASPLPPEPLEQLQLTEKWLASLDTVNMGYVKTLAQPSCFKDNLEGPDGIQLSTEDVILPPPPPPPQASIETPRSGDDGYSIERPKRKRVLFSEPTRVATKKRALSSSDTSSSVASSVAKKRKLIALIHNYSLSPQHYVKQLRAERQRVHLYRSKLKASTRTSVRRKKKIHSLRQVVQELRKQCSMSTSALDHLEQCCEGIPLALMKRMLANDQRRKITREAYPKELREFAMTLQFYSQKAYSYVRRIFNFSLPGQSTIRSWMANVDCEPGFSKLSFQALTKKAEDFKAQTHVPLMVALLVDEMSIKKYIEVEQATCTVRGYVDLGCGVSANVDPATEVLVFMLVGVNCHFKIPIGYFFITKLSGTEKANLVNHALQLLHDETQNVQVLSLTCDGPPVNFTMIGALDCNVHDITHLKTYFLHPITKCKVYIILDVVHMLKLIRNTLDKLKQIRDPDGNIIDWNFIEKLHELQENEGFVLANKLRKQHIQFRKQIMKVKLAVQTLSQSVADALEFVATELELPEFRQVTATCNFIRKIDGLFDLLNSRNPFGHGYKTPLRAENEGYWRPFMEDCINYLSKCTTLEGQPLYQTRYKTGFIGFIISATSLLQIYDDQIKRAANMKYLLTYKFSQDHLELFFCSIRSRNGWINNPSCLEFIRTYKRLLVGHNINAIGGNCTAQDQTETVITTPFQQPVEITDICNIRKAEQVEELSAITDNLLAISDELSLPVELSIFSENVVSYIAGYVIKMIQRLHRCEPCIDALLLQDDGDLNYRSLKLIQFKSRGGLLLPSHSLRDVCTTIEKRIQFLYKILGQFPSSTVCIDFLLKETHRLMLNTHLFPTLADHELDTPIGDTLHRKILIALIIKCYAKIRLNSIAKAINESIVGNKIRTTLGRLIIFKHQ